MDQDGGTNIERLDGEKNLGVLKTMKAKEGLVNTIFRMAFTSFQPLYIIYLVALCYFEIKYREFVWNKFTPLEEALKGGAYFFIGVFVLAAYLISVELLRTTRLKRVIKKTKITRLIISILFCSILLFLGKGSHEVLLLFLPWIMLGAIYSKKIINLLYMSTFIVLCFTIPMVIIEFPDIFWEKLLLLIFFTYGIAIATGYSWNRITNAESRYSNLNDIISQFNMFDSLEDILKGTLESCMEITKAKNGWLLLPDQVSNKLILRARIEAGNPVEILNEEPSWDKGIIGFVAKNKETYLCKNVSKDKNYVEFYPGVRSELCVPMLLGNDLIGIIDIDSPVYNGFDEFDKNHIASISMAAASSIKRINYIEDLNKVMRINGLIARSLRLDAVLETFLTESIRLLSGDYGLILFVDSALKLSKYKISNSLHTLAVEEIKQRVEKNRKTSYDYNIEWIQNMTEICDVIKSGKQYIYQNVAKEPGKDRFILHWFFKEAFGSVIAKPLEYENKVIGELTIGFTEPNAFSNEQVRLLEMIGEQASIAIKNAYDFWKTGIDLEMKNREIETIDRIINIITAKNVDEVIKLILSEACELVNAVSGHVRLFDSETENLVLKACIGEYEKFAEPVKKLGNDLASNAFIEGKPICITHSQDDKYYTDRLKRYQGTQKYDSFMKFFKEFKTALVVPFKGEAGLKGYLIVFSKFNESETQIHINLLKRFAGLMVTALNVARLNEITKEKSQERKAKLKLLSQIGLSLREAENFDQLMKLIVKHTFKTLNSESCSLFLLNKESLKLERKEYEAEGELIFEESYGIDEGITGQLLSRRTGETIMINGEDLINRNAIPKYLKEYKNALPSGKIEHLLAVPLVGEKKKVFGALRIMNKKSQDYYTADKANKLKKNGFSKEDKELMETIGSTVSVAISSDRKEARLKIIARTSSLITALDDTKKIASEIVKAITSEPLGYSFCVLSLVENEELVPIDSSGTSDDYIKSCTIHLGEDISGKAILEDEIKYIEDVSSNDPDINKGYPFIDFVQKENLKSLLAIPLLVGDFPIGEISVYTRQIYTFLPYEIEILETLANQVAIAISNSRYMREKLLFDERMKNIMSSSIVEQISSSTIHDVNSLFNNLKTQLELVEYDIKNKDITEAKKNLEIAFNDIKKASGYTETLQFYRKARGGETRKDVREIIKLSCEMYSGTAQRRGIKLSPVITNLPTKMKILVNENKLLTVLLNFIFNAVDFSNDRGTVHVRASYSSNDRCVQIEVQDYGRGMDEETKNHIFEPFFTTKERDLKKEGTGLGLYIVKNICTKMQWKLSFESKKFKGTKFTINICMEDRK